MAFIQSLLPISIRDVKEGAFVWFQILFCLSSKGKNEVKKNMVPLHGLASRVRLSISDSTKIALQENNVYRIF